MDTKPKLLTKFASSQEQQRVPKHKHCPVCGTPIEIAKEFCSDKCRTEHKRYSRGKVRNMVLITGGVIAIYVLVLLFWK
jgi:predicted nucleic acid-binding Zn ribbon protein